MKSIDVYKEVTDRLIASLDRGIIPWKRGWGSSGLPENFSTKKQYRGINILILLDATLKGGFGCNRWLTYNQAKQLKGFIRRGQKGTRIVFWKRGIKTDDEGEETGYTVAKQYCVFNYEQCTDLPAIVKAKRDLTPAEETELLSDLWYGYKDRPQMEQGAPAYVPKRDIIQMPKIDTFHSDRKFYHTLLHEMVHSTGSITRLKREGIKRVAFGSETYSKEELIAEIGSSMLTALTGVPQDDSETENSAAYIQSWRQKLTDDPKLIFRAASESQKAADWITGNRNQYTDVKEVIT